MKKAFFDGWDNLFGLVLLNMGFVLLVGLGIVLPPLFGARTLGFWLALGFVGLLGSVWWSTCVHALKAVADYGRLAWRDLPALALKAALPGLQYGALTGLFLVALAVGLPFYLSRAGFLGALAAGLLLWCFVLFTLAFQWYLPLRARFGGGFMKNLRKCLVFSLDNSLFSLFVFVYNAAGFVLSCGTALLMPGLAGLALCLDDALRLRALKYDWLEANPGVKRSQLPWDSLLIEEKELVGKRTLKGMIFPWKE